MARFTDEEVRRYARQMVLPEVGGVGQERLRAARVAAGGELEALYLVAAGVGTVSVPTEAVAEECRALNPLVSVIVDASASANANANGAEAALATIRQVLGL